MSKLRRVALSILAVLLLSWLSLGDPPAAWASPAQQADEPEDVQALTAGWAVQVSAGAAFTCAATYDGGVRCWGANSTSELGDGGTRARAAAVAVIGLSEPITGITTGWAHACALTQSGGVLCWGSNNYGQLGDGTNANRPTPTPVAGLDHGVMAIDAGDWHTCALLNQEGLRCWGRNEDGQLGDGTTSNRLMPVDVIGLAGAVQNLSAGASHTCAVTITGAMQCWGANQYGQLGDGSQVTRWAPTPVVGLSNGMQSVSAGEAHTCGVTAGGGVKCWGANVGLLGDGTTDQRLTPVDVVGLTTGVLTVSAAREHSCALTVDGGVKCWGANKYGQLGDGTAGYYSLVPVDVVGLANGARAVTVGANGGHSCALTETGHVECWGANWTGQLGDGTLVDRAIPAPVWNLEYDCSTTTELPESECNALVAFFKATNGPLWQGRAGWLRTSTPCSWQGVSCGSGHVVQLDLPANQLVDALPAAVGDLVYTTRLDLSRNGLVEPLPATFGNLRALHHFDLSENGLAGDAVLPEVARLTSLQTLDLHGNALSGEISPELGALTELHRLDLHGNSLEGPVPPQLGALIKLLTLDLSANALDGPIPGELDALTGLRTLDLHANLLSGVLPGELGRLVALQTLVLSDNGLTGAIPPALGNATALSTLDLHGNALTGVLPWTLSRLTTVRRIDLAHNQLTGELPREWSLLADLQHLDLSYNELEGWLPSEYYQLTSLRRLDLSFNEFRGVLPAEWGSLPLLEEISLNNNHLEGVIPATWGALGSAATYEAWPPIPPGRAWWSLPPPGMYLDLSCNRLGGEIPAPLSEIHGLVALNVASNRLRGRVPDGFFPHIAPHLYAEDNLLELPGDVTQIVPPTNVQAVASARDAVTLTWIPISYYGGLQESYEIGLAITPGGPFVVVAQAGAGEGSYTITGLEPDVSYYFRLRTFSPAHWSQAPGWGEVFEHEYYQQNNLWSDYTPVVCVNCEGTPVSPRAFLPILLR